jgi:hypothetical protein
VTSQRRFIRFVVVLAAIVLSSFALEFLWEWNRLGQPGFKELSWAGTNNPKLADVLSPMARAYNNILAMLLATIALAIPLTANMYTPKLIDMFIRDRINQFMLLFWAVGAAHVLWVLYMIGPAFAPMWSYYLAILGALLGWIALVPYFFYIVRYLDPSNILTRLQEDATRTIDEATAHPVDLHPAQTKLNDRLYEIGTMLMKTIDRGERGVALEGLNVIDAILLYYGQRKSSLPDAWFVPQKEHFVGVSEDALHLLQIDHTWVEHRALTHIFLAYQMALSKSQDVISSLSKSSRIIARHASERNDLKAMELSIKFFNNYLREAIKRKDLHAIYDLFYQYRSLASGQLGRPEVVQKIARYFDIYSDLAEASGLPFVPQIVSFDLGWLVRKAYDGKSAAAPALLDALLEVRNHTAGDPRLLVLKAKAILGGYFTAKGLSAEAARLRDNLAEIPPATIERVEKELMTLEDPSFWEVTDRQMMFEWIPHADRPSVKTFLESVKGRISGS